MKELSDKFSKAHGLPLRLVEALIAVESSGNPWALRYEPSYRWLYEPKRYARELSQSFQTELFLQRCSFGLMQVMGALGRELGHKGLLTELLQPELSLSYGCLYLSQLKSRYGSWEGAVAAYNAGSPRFRADGTYVNQAYVTKVMSRYEGGIHAVDGLR